VISNAASISGCTLTRVDVSGTFRIVLIRLAIRVGLDSTRFADPPTRHIQPVLSVRAREEDTEQRTSSKESVPSSPAEGTFSLFVS